MTPSQSSFFAGEELRCFITFTNTNQPVPASQPLPSTSRFEDRNGSSSFLGQHDNRRIASQLEPPQSPFKHGKSQSMDLRGGHSGGGLQRNGYLDDSRAGQEDLSSEVDLNGDGVPTRRRMIGRNAQPLIAEPDQPGSSTPRKHTKSSSMVSFSPSQASSPDRLASGSRDGKRGSEIGIGRPSRPPSNSHLTIEDAESPRHRSTSGSSTPGRRVSANLPANHPHSRKKSVIQVQHEDLSASFELSPGVQSRSASNLSVPPDTLDAQQANPSDVSIASAFDESPGQDQSRRSSVVVGNGTNGMYSLARNDTMDSLVRDQLTSWSKGATAPGQGVNGMAGSSPLFPKDRNAAASGSETVLWSFAQFSGQYEVDESLIKPAEFESVKRRLAYGDDLTSPSTPSTPMIMGGGDLGHEDDAAMKAAAAASGWSAYLRSALGSNVGSVPSTGGRHRRTGSTMIESRQKTMLSRSIPVFSSPPSILAIDLTIPPGESKTFSFSLQLPTDLPPSYFGKAIKINYELVVGTNRVDPRRSAAKVGNQRSRLIKIPLRVYNHINILGASTFFDLTNPIILLRDEAKVGGEHEGEEVDESLRSTRRRRRSSGSSKTLKSLPMEPSLSNKKLSNRGHRALKRYTESLLATCNLQDPSTSDPLTDVEMAMQRLATSRREAEEQMRSEESELLSLGSGGTKDASGLGGEEEDGSSTCKGAIEILSRNSQKVSFDIAKDGQVAAVLTLVKSKFRVGDSILGVVTINKMDSVARVVRIAASLESYEEIEASLATLTPNRIQRMTKTVHAEHHESTLDTGQASFSLPIPSGATPGFSTSGGE